MGALDALIYGIRDLFSGAGATPQNKRTKLWLRDGFTVTDDPDNGRTIVDSEGGGAEAPEGDEDDAVALDGEGGFKAIGPVVVLPEGLTAGDIIYWDGAAFARLAIGPEGYVLGSVGGLPAWVESGAAPVYDPAERTLHVWVG